MKERRTKEKQNDGRNDKKLKEFRKIEKYVDGWKKKGV